MKGVGDEGKKGRKQVSKAVTKSTATHPTNVKYLTNMIHPILKVSSYVGQTFGKISYNI